MLKYLEHEITFREIPDEISLCINITGCPIHCKGCHSKHLWDDIGIPLTLEELHKLIDPYKEGLSCVALMGGDQDPEEINFLALEIKQTFPGLKIAWYSGKESLSSKIDISRFDYIKIGPYKEEFGPLDSKTTNQRFYKIVDKKLEDITFKFWK